MQLFAQLEILLLLLSGLVLQNEGIPEVGSAIDIAMSTLLLVLTICVLAVLVANIIGFGRRAYWSVSTTSLHNRIRRALLTPVAHRFCVRLVWLLVSACPFLPLSVA